jgi:hypothetical protein
MKSTIEILDDLLIAARKRAAELRQPLRMLVEDGLRQQLLGPQHRPSPKRRKFRWVVSKGELPPGVDFSSRAILSSWLRNERKN